MSNLDLCVKKPQTAEDKISVIYMEMEWTWPQTNYELVIRGLYIPIPFSDQQ